MALPRLSHAAAALVTAATACAASACHSLNDASTPVPAAGASPALVDAGGVQLVQEPVDGLASIYGLLNGARASIDMSMYALTDTTAEQDLINAAHRGVTVRVLLNQDYTGRKTNASAYAKLQAGGVQPRWAQANVIYHEKAMVIDGHTLAISTGNLEQRYYPTGVDAWIITTNPAQAAAADATFNTDYAATADSPAAAGSPAPGLVWSPGATTTFADLIDSAKTSVWFSSEELTDTTLLRRLEAAGRRGVDCRVMMTDNPKWHTAFHALAAAGCHVRVYSPTADRYIHEKQLILDNQTALIGSTNATSTSLDRNRELAITLAQPTVVSAAATTFTTLYSAAAAE